MSEESSVSVILAEFENYPQKFRDQVWNLADALSGNKLATYLTNPEWSEDRRQQFIQQVWSSRNAYRRDLWNQPIDGVQLNLALPNGYGEDYVVTLLDYITDTNRCQAQIYEGYGSKKNLWVGAKVVLAINRSVFEGSVGEVIAESHGKWLVAFLTEDGMLHGRFYSNELINLGDYHATIQSRQNLDEGGAGG